MTYGPVNGVMSEMLYDCRNRLVEAGDIRYFYDAENNRIAMENGEYREEYVTDTVSSSLSCVLMSTRYRLENDKAEEPMLYIYGSGLIYEYSGDIYLYHHYNNLGSTMKLTDDFGDVVASYTYGVYGELLSGDTGLTRFLYNGRCGVTTDDNGLYYMRQRYYNPEIKRFVNQDILTGSMGNSQSLNRYSYVQGNPVSYTDPFGLSPLGGLFTGTGLAHGVLGVLGCLPGLPGAIFNGIDAWVYATIDKDYFMATMAGLSAVSFGIGGIAKWAGKAATAGTKGAKAFGYMSTIGSCMSNGIEFAQNGIQTAVAAYDAWNAYTQTGSADAGSVAGVGLSALATIWSGANLSKSSKEFGKMLKEDGVTGKFRQAYTQLTNGNRGCVDFDALGEGFWGRSSAGVVLNKIDGETGELNYSNIMHALRASNSVEGDTVAKLLKSGRLNVKIKKRALDGRGGGYYERTKTIVIYREAIGADGKWMVQTPNSAAGFLAHETKHWIDGKVTRKIDEFNAYMWQKKVNPNLKYTDEDVWHTINTHPAYKHLKD